MRVVEVTDWPAFQERVAALERGTTYPLGDDRFEIDHGADYPAFLRRLGDLRYFAALDGERVAAIAAGAIRTLPGPRGPTRAWYVGDLKVHPDYRGRRLPWEILKYAFPRHYWRCPRGYAVTMDPPDRPNPVTRLLSRFWLIPNAAVASLRFWSLDADAARDATPLVERHRGPLAWLSLAGVKDLVLRSTGRPMPLLHAQFGPCAATADATRAASTHAGGVRRAPSPGAVHMLCAPVGDALADALVAAGHAPTATATVLAHRMARWDWSFLLTSDI